MSKTFVRAGKGEQLLAIAMEAAQFGGKPSERLEIQDETIALAFNQAASVCLYQWKMEQERQRLEAQAAGFAGGLTGAEPSDFDAFV